MMIDLKMDKERLSCSLYGSIEGFTTTVVVLLSMESQGFILLILESLPI